MSPSPSPQKVEYGRTPTLTNGPRPLPTLAKIFQIITGNYPKLTVEMTMPGGFSPVLTKCKCEIPDCSAARAQITNHSPTSAAG